MNRSHKLLLLLAVICVLALSTSYFIFSPDKTSKAPELKKIGQEYISGPFKVQVKINPEQPRVGNNRLTLIILDKHNQPVANASIKAVAEMPAMGSMPTMYAPAEITSKQPGLYQGKFQIPMMGAWPLTLTINAGSQGQAQLSFDMGTSRKGLSITSATPSTFETQSERKPGSASLQAKTFTVDAYRRQLIGVTTEAVSYINMTKTIAANAQISYDETGLSDINLKFDGWIGQLNADYVGKQVKKGQPLFTVYSPELISTQDEYLHSLKRSQAGHNSLKAAAVRRLSLWGLNRTQIIALGKRGHSVEYVPFLSPITGTIIEKNIVSGSAFKASSKLLRIADLSTVWVDGHVYAADLPWLKTGMTAQVIQDDSSNNHFTGNVTFIEPFVENETRAARVRVELANPDGFLRPEQYVRLELQVDLGKRLVVPEQAVVFTGKNRIVFLDMGDGRLQARKIKTGVRNNDFIEVVEGLDHGDVIVSSGNFLIASESKLKLGLEQW